MKYLRSILRYKWLYFSQSKHYLSIINATCLITWVSFLALSLTGAWISAPLGPIIFAVALIASVSLMFVMLFEKSSAPQAMLTETQQSVLSRMTMADMAALCSQFPGTDISPRVTAKSLASSGSILELRQRYFYQRQSIELGDLVPFLTMQEKGRTGVPRAKFYKLQTTAYLIAWAALHERGILAQKAAYRHKGW